MKAVKLTIPNLCGVHLYMASTPIDYMLRSIGDQTSLGEQLDKIREAAE